MKQTIKKLLCSVMLMVSIQHLHAGSGSRYTIENSSPYVVYIRAEYYGSKPAEMYYIMPFQPGPNHPPLGVPMVYKKWEGSAESLKRINGQIFGDSNPESPYYLTYPHTLTPFTKGKDLKGANSRYLFRIEPNSIVEEDPGYQIFQLH